MTKSKQLNQWLWKWHIIGGLVSVPIMALLCVTGSIYLFKSNYNDYVYQDSRFVEVPADLETKSYAQQLLAAEDFADGHIMKVTLPSNGNNATAFKQHANGHSTNLVYVDPYTAEVTGTYIQNESLMQTVRKLHGELLLGQAGTLFVELVASWFIVLAITGIYIWWPYKRFAKAGFFTVRTTQGRRLMWRDLHSVLAFWMSVFMLIILAGGMPWTTLFGDQLKWVQKQTQTGYPQYWRDSKGLTSTTDAGGELPITLDQVITIGNSHKLDGKISVSIPMQADGVYTITNRALWLEDQKVIHVDQYSGEVIKTLNWNQVGILMELRQIFMRLHQGEYGRINLIVVLGVAQTFFLATLASLTSYLMRRQKGSWSIPNVPDSFNVGIPIVIIIALLGIVFPAFGASVILIFCIQWYRGLRRNSYKFV